jgi:hypothetical protein
MLHRRTFCQSYSSNCAPGCLLSLQKCKKAQCGQLYESCGALYSLAMCHDDYKGNSFLSRRERRYFQTDEVHEFKGENMEQIKL